MNFSLLVGLSLLTFCILTNAQTSFYSTSFTVKIGSVTYVGTSFQYNANSHVQQIIYPFGVEETEFFQNGALSPIKYQICQGGCSSYVLPYPEPKYLPKPTSGLTTALFDTKQTLKITYTQTVTGGDSYTTTVYYLSSNGNLYAIQQSGPSFPGDRVIIFNSYSTGTPGSIPTRSSYSSCPSVQCNAQMDVMLVSDSSGSISNDDYTRSQSFLIDITNSLNMGTNAVNVGYLAFSTITKLISPLTGNKAQLQTLINGAQQINTETNIGDAIKDSQAQLDLSNRNVNKVMILITDGEANVGTDNPIQYMLDQATAAKQKGTYIYTVAVGVSASGQTALNNVATGPGYNYTIANFSLLSSIIQGLTTTVCSGNSQSICSPSCSSNQFCGCGECTCSNAGSNVCGTRGTYNPSTCACDSCTGVWTNTGASPKYCSACTLDCNNGDQFVDLNTDSCTCDCRNNWVDTSATDKCSKCSDSCTANQVQNPDCNGCGCAGLYTGASCNICQTCKWGTIVGNCDHCSCANANVTGTLCDTCKSTTCPAPNCISVDPSKPCTQCICANQWSGDFCTICPIDCNGNGSPNSDCTGCTCSNTRLNPSTNCATCKTSSFCKHGGTLIYPSCDTCSCPPGNWGNTQTIKDCSYCSLTDQCGDGGVPNTGCTGCDCLPGWAKDSNGKCTVCDSSYCNSIGTLTPATPTGNCKCTCKTGFGSDVNDGANGKCNVCTNNCDGKSSVTITINNCNSCSCTGLWDPSFDCNKCKTDTNLCNGHGDLVTPGDITDCGCVCYQPWTAADCNTCISPLVKDTSRSTCVSYDHYISNGQYSYCRTLTRESPQSSTNTYTACIRIDPNSPSTLLVQITAGFFIDKIGYSISKTQQNTNLNGMTIYDATQNRKVEQFSINLPDGTTARNYYLYLYAIGSDTYQYGAPPSGTSLRPAWLNIGGSSGNYYSAGYKIVVRSDRKSVV